MSTFIQTPLSGFDGSLRRPLCLMCLSMKVKMEEAEVALGLVVECHRICMRQMLHHQAC